MFFAASSNCRNMSCDDFCFPVNNDEGRCECQDRYQLANDGTSCEEDRRFCLNFMLSLNADECLHFDVFCGTNRIEHLFAKRVVNIVLNLLESYVLVIGD